MAVVDVVVVSYNSAGSLRQAVEELAVHGDLHVIVVDNASQDASVAAVRDLPLDCLPLNRNGGFAYGCNRGWPRGSAPAVLFLNPDARIDVDSILRMATVLRDDEQVGIVAPAIVDADGSPEPSLRRFPRVRSTFARSLFLHRLLPRAPWVDEVVRDPARYERPGTVEWASGACLLVRRSLLERLGGWDERFFLYGEDVDICRRAWDSGYEVRYEPAARAVHAGGGSAPRAQLLPLLARSRVQYARLHAAPLPAFLERAGIALGELTHAAVSTKGASTRRGHWQAFLETGLGRRTT